MTSFTTALAALPGWSAALSQAGLRAGVAIAVALLLHFILLRTSLRLARLSATRSDDIVFAQLAQPARWSFVAIALSIAQEADPLLASLWSMTGRFIVPLLLGWMAFAIVKAFSKATEAHDSSAQDAVAARSRQTRIAILSRSARFVIVFVTVALVLFGIPGVRNIGVTLMASAGFAGLVFGLAAQPALKSLFAGIQIALTEPIRLGDHVVIEGEAGRVEDIRLSYVVLRAADQRRLIVPTAKFIDGTFQNWTRKGGGITGHVLLPVMPGTAIAPLREAYLALLDQQPAWDRRNAALHLSDARPGVLELRLVMSAKDPADLGMLRFTMREAMLEWLRTAQPDALCTTS